MTGNFFVWSSGFVWVHLGSFGFIWVCLGNPNEPRWPDGKTPKKLFEITRSYFFKQHNHLRKREAIDITRTVVFGF